MKVTTQKHNKTSLTSKKFAKMKSWISNSVKRKALLRFGAKIVLLCILIISIQSAAITALISSSYPWLISNRWMIMLSFVPKTILEIVFVVFWTEILFWLIFNIFRRNSLQNALIVPVKASLFCYLFVSFSDLFLGFSLTILVILGVIVSHSAVEVLIDNPLQEIKLNPKKLDTDTHLALSELEHILIWASYTVFLIVLLAVSAYLADLLVLHIRPVLDQYLVPLAVYVAVGTGISQIIEWRRELSTPKEWTVAGIPSSLIICIFGFQWDFHMIFSELNALWGLSASILPLLHPFLKPIVSEYYEEKNQTGDTDGIMNEISSAPRFNKFMIALAVLSFLMNIIYNIVGSPFHVDISGDLFQVSFHWFDPCFYFFTGDKLIGVSTFGFLFPLVLMTYIILVKSKQWDLSIDRYYTATLSLTLIISLLFDKYGDNGVILSRPGLLFLIVGAAAIGWFSDLVQNSSKGIQLLSAVWFGLVPADILYGLAFEGSFLIVPVICVGGNGWGIGDGLWIMSFLIVSIMIGLSALRAERQQKNGTNSKEEPKGTDEHMECGN
jgi:hypothetical protein